jgi:hypothetical protein
MDGEITASQVTCNLNDSLEISDSSEQPSSVKNEHRRRIWGIGG